MMMESRDPAIKLFGKKIPFPAVAVEEEEEWSGGDGGEEDESADKVTPELSEKRNNCSLNKEEEEEEETTSANQVESSDSPQNINEQTSEGKTLLKKPTKILPCPRCKSMDTKFCYYNNYNINQPRHFCKACQRYWTAGGTMRNVPVGAGRRKNKSSSSHSRHITISAALEAARLDPGLQPNTRVLSFGLEPHQPPVQGGHKISNGLADQTGDDCSSGSSVTTSNNNHPGDESRAQSCRVVEPQMNGFACIPGVPWPYTWNSAMPPPGYYPPPGYPMPFYPYWTIPMPVTHKGSSPNSPTLGKHSRDEDNDTERKQRNGCVLVPKTLRIDDPNEAAKSSIWTTLGIKNEVMSKGGMFKGYDHKMKNNRNNDKADNSPLLSANPAALSRSLIFHERI